MLKVDITQLVAAIRTATPFTLPEMNVGTQYIRDEICIRLANGNKVKFTDIDFSAFDLENIDDFRDYLYEVSRVNYKSGTVVQSLRNIEPAAVSIIFV